MDLGIPGRFWVIKGKVVVHNRTMVVGLAKRIDVRGHLVVIFLLRICRDEQGCCEELDGGRERL